MDPHLASTCFDFLTLLETVYKIPPLRANVGYRAGEWGDLAEPLWKGRLRILERSSGVVMQFEDSQTGWFTTLSATLNHKADPIHRLPPQGNVGQFNSHIFDPFTYHAHSIR